MMWKLPLRIIMIQNINAKKLKTMQDWKKILKSIYTPDIGSLWAVPNKIWDNGFASNKAGEELNCAA